MPRHDPPPDPGADDTPEAVEPAGASEAPETAADPPPGQAAARRTTWGVGAVAVVGVVVLVAGFSRSGAAPVPSGTPTPSTAVASPTPSAGPSTPPTRRASLRAGTTIGSATYAVPRGAVVVAVGGSDANPGTLGSPVATLRRALEIAPSGGTVVVRGGTYHQGGLSITSPVTVQSYPGEKVWFDGARTVSGFTPVGRTWAHAGWRPVFDHSPTYRQGANDAKTDQWRWINPAYPMASYPDMVWMHGAAQRQVRTRAQVVPGTFFVDTSHHVLYLGTDPTGRTVEASDLQQFAVIRAADVTIRGIGVRRYATSVPQMGALTVYGANATLEAVEVDDNATQGIGIGSTGATLRHVTADGNGLLGIQAVYADGIVLDAVRAERDDSEHFNPAPNAGGIKITRSRGVTLRNSVVSHNEAQGFWCDESCFGMTIVGNDLVGNSAAGIITEISDTGTVADNVVTDNHDDGLRVADTGNLQVWNNTFARNKRDISITQDSRTQTDLGVAGHDPRQSLPDSTVPWLTSNITIRNNVLDCATGDSLLGVEDFTLARTAEQMGVSADHDGYARSSPLTPMWLTVWSAGQSHGGDPFVFLSLPEFRAGTHQEAHGQEAESAGPDAVTVFPSLVAAPLPRGVAVLVRKASGTAHIGAWG
jgi:parallel beta-helix repeat protein